MEIAVASTPIQRRARKLRKRAFMLDVQMKDLAEMLGYARTYLSSVLSGDVVSRTALDAIEAKLNEIEAEQKSRKG